MKRLSPAFALLLMVASLRCGNGGGIVDNGAKDEDSEAPPLVSGSAAPDTPKVVVLTDYSVELPSKEWARDTAFDAANATRLVGKDSFIVFTAGQAACDVAAEANAHAIQIYACTETTSVLVDGSNVIAAAHSPRTDAITQILHTFRRVKP